MRWESLFEDLEAQAAAERQSEFEAEVAATLTLEWSRVALMDRLRAHLGAEAALRLRGGIDVTLRLSTVGANWLAGTAGVQDWLVQGGAVLTVRGLQRKAQAEPSQARRNLGIASPLRALAASREAVSVLGEQGRLAEGLLTGVGLDFIDLRTPGGLCTVPLAAVLAVRSSAL
ncbi:hypothetical protein [Nesterenkonia alkaliphila]|uniref:Fis family transcriptional regulator n=1 Tax=Nesterenkonia alkaliphila TaxID=1463631 RepID=A0A7K1UK98_9MICC|nr:hypothetical protein [Nesterenkonia alkaliphila]MVT26899.1 hypothetical protein [Nesterenkonia alkaliphila]GFZ82135.1 hypothetical protein GCM10011359_08410 [Nesterenkonia alkaliphila]